VSERSDSMGEGRGDRQSLAAFAAPRNQISLAVEIISAQLNVPGTDAYKVLVQAAEHARMSVGDTAAIIAGGADAPRR
jgi:hypothetical protein